MDQGQQHQYRVEQTGKEVEHMGSDAIVVVEEVQTVVVEVDS